MSFKKIYVALTAMTLFALGISAQNMQSASSYSKMHSDLLAKQSRVKDQIRVQEAQKYAADRGRRQTAPEVGVFPALLPQYKRAAADRLT